MFRMPIRKSDIVPSKMCVKLHNTGAYNYVKDITQHQSGMANKHS